MSELSPETLHKSILKSYAEFGALCVNACGEWLIGIDETVEPTLITLDSIDTGVGYALDGSLILTRSNDEPYAFFIDAKNEKDALLRLKKLFGGN